MANDATETPERSLPHSADAEKGVLGSILVDFNCLPEVVENVRVDDFYVPINREIYGSIYTLFSEGSPMDLITLINRLELDGVFHGDTTRNYLASLMDFTPTAANVSEYIDILLDRSLMRRIAVTAETLLTNAHDTGNTGRDLLEMAEKSIYDLRRQRQNRGLVSLGTVLLDVYDRLAELAKSDAPQPGLSTGLTELDRAIAGLNRSDLILLAARPGMGKTSMALNILLHAGKTSGKNVAFFSLEMNREQLAMRLISNECFIDNKKLITGKLSQEDWDRVLAAAESLNQASIFLDDDSTVTVADISAKCRRMDNLGLVIIDYLQLMQSAGGKVRPGDNRQQIVSDISRSLKLLAKDLDIPVLCLSQLSRANESRQDKRPQLSDLRESGAIEQDADIVMFLYRDGYYNKDSQNPNTAECIIAKNRHGETRTIELQWLPEYTTFSNLEWQHKE